MPGLPVSAPNEGPEKGSIRTGEAKLSAGPLEDACEPTFLISIRIPFFHSNGLTAVRNEGVSDDETGGIGTEPENRIGDFFRRAHAANGLLGDPPLFAFRCAAGEPLHHWGGDNPGTHGVDPNV